MDASGDGARRALGTDAEALTLLADLDRAEADGLDALVRTRSPWPGVLDEERAEPNFRAALELVDPPGETYPRRDEVFTAFELTPFERVRVVILGQDPYPNAGQAMGLAFSVPREVPLPPSLRNIHAAMRMEELTPPAHGDLSGWARQGVLLLNAALTVPAGAPGKHLATWRPFTDAVLRRLAARDDVVFVLWGSKAQSVVKRGVVPADPDRVVTAPHPAARGTHQAVFRGAGTFGKVNALLRERGEQPIDWEQL